MRVVQINVGSSVILPFFLETIEFLYFFPYFCSYSSRMRLFSFVPLTIMASLSKSSLVWTGSDQTGSAEEAGAG